MNNLEVGMFVRFIRTNETFIRKIVSFYEKTLNGKEIVILDKPFYGCRYSTNKKNILKASHNIIDLIEAGDYVNGYLVTSINPITIRIEKYNNYWSNKIMDNKDVKSIVTKEQFESLSYKI